MECLSVPGEETHAPLASSTTSAVFTLILGRDVSGWEETGTRDNRGGVPGGRSISREKGYISERGLGDTGVSKEIMIE